MDAILAGEVRYLTVTEPIDFEERYKFVKEISDEYKCVVCSKLLREPQVTECCGQHFCQYCLEQWLKSKYDAPCPHCRTLNCNYIRYLPMKREIYELKVYCPNQILGCLTITTLQQINGHLKMCEFEEVDCTCNKKVLRKEFTNHQQNLCPKRIAKCQYCRRNGTYEIINSAHHQNTCQDFPIYCPKGCGDYGKRKNYESHRNKCPLELVECKYFKTGCRDKIHRRDYDAHERDNVQQHLQLTMESFTRLSKEHDKLKTVHEKHRNDMKRETARLSKECNTLKRENTQLKQRTQRTARSSGYSSDTGCQRDDDYGTYTYTRCTSTPSTRWQPARRVQSTPYRGPRRYRQNRGRGRRGGMNSYGQGLNQDSWQQRDSMTDYEDYYD